MRADLLDPIRRALGQVTRMMETQSSSLSWVAQAVLLMLADSRTGATATQLSGQMFLPKHQVDDALGELAAGGHARRHGRRWRAVLGARVRELTAES